MPTWLVSVALRRTWAILRLPIYRFASSLAPLLQLYYGNSLRRRLPETVRIWREDSFGQPYFSLWDSLRPLFAREGYTLWAHDETNDLGHQIITTLPAPGHWFQDPLRVRLIDGGQFWPSHGAQHALRGRDGKDYIVSVHPANDNHLRILRRLSHTKPDILLPNNHILPIAQEILLEDIVFSISPLLQADLNMAMVPFPEKSVEDLLYMVMQAFEATKYIHSKNIAHRDLFLENFLVEWVPGSLKWPCSVRPRVYLIDFETAVEFAQDSNQTDRVCHEPPFSFETYRRPMPLELDVVPLSYCPFRLDIWQLGYAFWEVLRATGIPAVDAMWEPLCADQPENRITAEEALNRLRSLLATTLPQQFLVPGNLPDA